MLSSRLPLRLLQSFAPLQERRQLSVQHGLHGRTDVGLRTSAFSVKPSLENAWTRAVQCNGSVALRKDTGGKEVRNVQHERRLEVDEPQVA